MSVKDVDIEIDMGLIENELAVVFYINNTSDSDINYTSSDGLFIDYHIEDESGKHHCYTGMRTLGMTEWKIPEEGGIWSLKFDRLDETFRELKEEGNSIFDLYENEEEVKDILREDAINYEDFETLTVVCKLGGREFREEFDIPEDLTEFSELPQSNSIEKLSPNLTKDSVSFGSVYDSLNYEPSYSFSKEDEE